MASRSKTKTATRKPKRIKSIIQARKVKPAKKVASKAKPKKSIRYRSPLAKKPELPKTVRFKKTRYPHDGQGIQFRIPTSWKETWGSEDNGLFYPPIPGLSGPSPIGGRLFVRFRLEPVGHANDAAAFSLLLSHRTDPSQTVVQLDSGAYMLHFQSRHQSEGFHAIDYYWFLAMPFPPRRVGLACFMFSGVAELFDGPKAPEAQIVAMLEKEIPQAIFDQERLPVEK
ncbi:MAG: hypothetical protein JNJ77_14580 [Planctomycetia bacterium]|nr:hypothetical protein [Planctomycetia bacterium]